MCNIQAVRPDTCMCSGVVSIARISQKPHSFVPFIKRRMASTAAFILLFYGSCLLALSAAAPRNLTMRNWPTGITEVSEHPCALSYKCVNITHFICSFPLHVPESKLPRYASYSEDNCNAKGTARNSVCASPILEARPSASLLHY